jgi:hypothetical protein
LIGQNPASTTNTLTLNLFFSSLNTGTACVWGSHQGVLGRHPATIDPLSCHKWKHKEHYFHQNGVNALDLVLKIWDKFPNYLAARIPAAGFQAIGFQTSKEWLLIKRQASWTCAGPYPYH